MNEKERISTKEKIKRYIACVLGLFVAAIGVAITKKGELGVSPVSSVANILSIRFDFFTIGNWLIVWNCILILGQILVLRKNFKWIQLMQIPLSFLFGWFTDFGMWVMSFVDADIYFFRLFFSVLGVVVLGFGVTLSVTANVIMNSGEAFVKAVSDTYNKEFGNVKIVFDITCVTLAIVLSLIFCDFKILGTREGTLIAAVLTGIMVKLYCKLFKDKINDALTR